MAGVLKAKVGGVWVPVTGSGMSAEVARWNSSWGVIARASSATGSTSVPVSTQTAITQSVTATLLSGRRYRLSYEARAIQPTDFGSFSFTFAIYDGAVATPWFDQWRFATRSSTAVYSGEYVDAIVNGDGVTRSLNVRCSGAASILTLFDDAFSGFTVEDVGPVSPAVDVPVQPASAWTPLPFTTNWYSDLGGWGPCGYRKIGDIVYIRGLANTTGAVSNTVATLPAGFRPPNSEMFTTQTAWLGTSVCRLDIQAGGAMVLGGSAPPAGGGQWLSLGGILFSVT